MGDQQPLCLTAIDPQDYLRTPYGIGPALVLAKLLRRRRKRPDAFPETNVSRLRLANVNSTVCAPLSFSARSVFNRVEPVFWRQISGRFLRCLDGVLPLARRCERAADWVNGPNGGGMGQISLAATIVQSKNFGLR